jgi:hypothetical protein
MKRIVFLLISVATLGGVVALAAHASRHSEQETAPISVTEIPAGYRDWKLISVAHEEGNLNSFAAILGNDVAIKAYREGKLPYPDGTIIAALHWRFVPSEENNKVFGRSQSFIAGPPTNVQFMVKDSKKYASTGDGVLLILTTANLLTRHCSKPASLATWLSKIATWSSPVMHPNAENL